LDEAIFRSSWQVNLSMQSRKTTNLVLQALLMAVWRRKPKEKVHLHSTQTQTC
jgi:putative transposase